MTRTEQIKISLAIANLRAIMTRETQLAGIGGGNPRVAGWAAEALASLSTLLRGESR